MKITEIALKNRLSTFVMMFIVIVAGYWSYNSLPKEASPDITIPLIVISTPYFGVSPADMENLVTRPIERELQGLSDVKEIRSTSSEGYSMITVEFMAGTDIDNALQKVREKVDLAKPDIPQDAEDPILTEINFSDMPIMIINVSGNMDLVGLKKIAENLEDQIETVPGVLDAVVTGGLTREVQVNLNPDRLRFYGIGVQDVIDAVRNEHLTIPGGTVELGDVKYLVRVPGEFKDPERMNEIVVLVKDGAPIYMRDVAEVIYSFEDREAISRLNGEETVSISVTKRTGTNLLDISDQVKELVKQLEQKVPPGIDIAITGDQSVDIRNMVNDLENNVISGLLLVVAVLFLAMGVRNAFLVGIAIPMSMLLSFLVLSLMGQSINMVVLFSLILAVGMLVDNAIVIVENIYRHHQEGVSLQEAAMTGTSEVGLPVVASTVTTLCAFAPLIQWPGIIGEFMSFLPKTLIITLSSSLVVALVFNPAICSRFLKSKGPTHKIEAREDRLGPILRRYLRALRFSMERPWTMFGGSLGLLVVIIALYSVLGKGVEFFPESDPPKIYVDIDAPSGTRLERSDDLVRQVEAKIAGLPDIENVVANVGHQGSDVGFSFGGGETNKSRVMIDFIDMEYRDQPSPVTKDSLRERLVLMSGADYQINQEDNGPPTGPPVNIEISGEDYVTLGRLAREMRGAIREIDGLINIRDDYESDRPELKVTVDREEAALLGINTFEIANTIRTAVNGTEAAKYRVGEDEYDNSALQRGLAQQRGGYQRHQDLLRGQDDTALQRGAGRDRRRYRHDQPQGHEARGHGDGGGGGAQRERRHAGSDGQAPAIPDALGLLFRVHRPERGPERDRGISLAGVPDRPWPDRVRADHPVQLAGAALYHPVQHHPLDDRCAGGPDAYRNPVRNHHDRAGGNLAGRSGGQQRDRAAGLRAATQGARLREERGRDPGGAGALPAGDADRYHHDPGPDSANHRLRLRLQAAQVRFRQREQPVVGPDGRGGDIRPRVCNPADPDRGADHVQAAHRPHGPFRRGAGIRAQEQDEEGYREEEGDGYCAVESQPNNRDKKRRCCRIGSAVFFKQIIQKNVGEHFKSAPTDQHNQASNGKPKQIPLNPPFPKGDF